HIAVDDVTVFSTWGVLALSFQNLKVIPMKRLRFSRRGTFFGKVTFFLGIRVERSQGTQFTVQIARPVEPVGLAGGTGDLLSILQNVVTIAVFARIFAL